MPYMQAHQSLSSCLVFCFVSPCPHAWCLSLGSAAFAAWQRLLVCVARKYLYTCTDAFALPSTALRHHSSTIYMHTRICLAQHGTRANAPSFLLLHACCRAVFECCCMHAVEPSLNQVCQHVGSQLSCNYTQIRKAITLYTQTHVKPYMPYTCRHINHCPHAWCFAMCSSKSRKLCSIRCMAALARVRGSQVFIYMHRRICLAQHGTQAS